MRLEDNVSEEIFRYTEIYWDIDRPHSRRRVLDKMFLDPASDFVWTKDGYLFNEERENKDVSQSLPYNKKKAKEFVDLAWLEEYKGRQRKGKWMPSPISEKSNLLNIPDNVKPDYLEGAYEIAKQAYAYFKTNSLDDYYIRVGDETQERMIQLVLNKEDSNYDSPYELHRLFNEGKLTFKTGKQFYKEQFESNIRRMCFALEDFFERYKQIKKQQSPIKVYLDDNREQPEGFDVQVCLASHVIDMLQFENVSLISLDNDLGNYSELEGYKVANFIEESAYHNSIKRLSVNVHSANTVRQKEIIASISQANKFWNKNG